jgi:hypothetical protein
MVLQSLCVPSPMEKKATPKGDTNTYEMLKPFYSRRTEITLYQGCLLWGISVIVPVKLRTQILNLYSGFSDIQNTVLLTSRCRYQFPATKHSFELTPSSLLRLGDFHVTDLRSVCEVWRAQWHVCPRVNIPEWPSSPLERVHIDFAGPFLDRMFLF